MGFYFGQLLTGLANASSLFLVASGLSIIFGVTRIVNFAHGSFYMLGAYLAYSLCSYFPSGILGFWGGIFCAAVIVAIVGACIEVLILRRIYRAPELFQLVATFGLVLIIQDVVLAIWGAEDLLGPRAPGLEHAVRIFGEPIPQYDLALILIGPIVLIMIWFVLHRTRWGTWVRAATQDREMVSALGKNQKLIFTSVFFLGALLAGLGGALQIPREAASLVMDLNIIAETFVVVVIGGMGSVVGAFIAAMIIGILNSFGIFIFPKLPLILPFLVMAVVLMIRPWGLLGKPESVQALSEELRLPLRLPSKRWILPVLFGLFLLATLPKFGDDFTLVLAIDILVMVLFAASLHLLMGLGGMASFGHAAYFGLGAYTVALAVHFGNWGMLQSLLLAPVVAALGALVFGWFCVRLSGVYFAMLTLAVAQILWGIVFQWQEVTGGDDGILGIWPPAWASSKTAYFYVVFTFCFVGIWFIHRLAHAPFGYALRGGRDSPLRSEAIGINLGAHRWAAFACAGALAGCAGALFAFSKGSVFPDELAIPRSIDGLIMVLLGGVHSLLGPVLGASVFILLEDWVSRLHFWRFIFGSLILFIVIVAPDGLAGGLRRLFEFLRRWGRWRRGAI